MSDKPRYYEWAAYQKVSATEQLEALRTASNGLLTKLFQGALPSDQPEATAFAILLLDKMARPSNARGNSSRRHILHTAPHSAHTKRILDDSDVVFSPGEWMVDAVVYEEQTSQRRLPIWACESEVHRNHGVGYSFDFDNDGYHVNDYAWDFCKLLHFRAPRLLFVAQTTLKPRNNPSQNRLDHLVETLTNCARDYSDLWADSLADAVLLPAAPTHRQEARIGVGQRGQELVFDKLFL